ncbi:MAG: hypothetical protein HY054_07575 [Proteobacteria bacterium]|nr:hypothetical protein [Pseudomonadota bacterium]
MSTFDEAVCGIFDDSGLGDILDSMVPRKRNLISDDVRAKAGELRRLVGQVSRERPEDIIRDPMMEKIRLVASELLALLDRD